MLDDIEPVLTLEGVSCLMVTLPVPERLAFAKRSIDDFCRQTYPAKTLVLVVNGGIESVRQALRDYVMSLNRTDIRLVAPPGVLNLGQLRNISLEAADDDIVCQWDDDDLYHPERLERQVSALTRGGLEAVYLQEVMQYLPEDETLYWTNWRAAPLAGHPGTLMARRSAGFHYPTQGANARLGEDAEVARTLIARGRVGYLGNMPHLYVYVSHGTNSWDAAHHRMLKDQLAISQALLRRREAQIRDGLEPYGFPADTLTVSGSNGAAFTL